MAGIADQSRRSRINPWRRLPRVRGHFCRSMRRAFVALSLTLGLFCLAQAQTDPVKQLLLFGNKPPCCLLDTLSTSPLVAYSTRKVVNAFAGNDMLAVTSNTGHATQNIGFVNNDLDLNSGSGLLSFITAGHDGGISTWYDQSGNGIDAAVATITGNNVANAPIIVNNHATVTRNSNPCPLFTGTTAVGNDAFFSFSQLGFSHAAQAQPFTIAAAFQATANSSAWAPLALGNGSTVQAFVGTTQYSLASPSLVAGGTTDTGIHGGFWIFNNAGSNIFIDGSDQIAGAGGNGTNGLWSPGPTNFAVFSNAPGGTAQMYICEFFVFAGTLGSSDRGLISTSWHNRWGTP